jgi:hypothetical protein
MKEPKRLLSHGATDFERQLLRAVANERPSALLRSRMQRSLGLIGPLAWASNVKAVVGNKLMIGAALGGLALAGGIAAYQFIPGAKLREEPRAVAHTPIEPGGATRASAPDVVAPRAAAPEPEAPSVAVSEAQAPPAPAPLGASPATEASEDGRLREEIALLDGVKAALSRGERDQARKSLDVYRERFPAGILRREANVLRRRAEAKPSRPVEGGSYAD